MPAVLEVNGISKVFRTYRSELQRVASWFGLSPNPAEEYVVLRDISFSMAPGEAIGIVGQNGSGKSTLLKIITGTLAPTQGRVTVRGHVSALLELGLGFNPEFTGRQNIYHSGGLMGLTQPQIVELMPEIEEFAEIGDYFDQPMRTYSSGMQMRLAFSLATAIRPEILIVDEAFSVGDAYFQHKSFERIRKFREQGTSLLLVSHDPGAVQTLCDRAILLDQGKMIKDGEPEEVMDFYNALIADRENALVEQTRSQDGKVETRSGNHDATIEQVHLLNETGEAIEYVKTGETVTLEVYVFIHNPVSELTVGYMIRDRLGQPVYGTNTFYLGKTIHEAAVGDHYRFLFHFSACLGEGSYSISVALHAAHAHTVKNYDWWDHALVFNVVNASHPQFTGVAWMPPQVECLT